jgi:hypothetical protein
MGIWRTNNNPSGFNVNIAQENIDVMKQKGASFCWMSDNVGINDENNKDYWENVQHDDNKGDDNNCDDNKGDNQNDTNGRNIQRKEGIQVVDSDGNTVIGYITHIVKGPCFGTPLRNWFIIQPGSYPTQYIKNKVASNTVVITDL